MEKPSVYWLLIRVAEQWEELGNKEMANKVYTFLGLM